VRFLLDVQFSSSDIVPQQPMSQRSRPIGTRGVEQVSKSRSQQVPIKARKSMRNALRKSDLWLVAAGTLGLFLACTTAFTDWMKRYWYFVLLLGLVVWPGILLRRIYVLIRFGNAGLRAFRRGDFVKAEWYYRMVVKTAEKLPPGGSVLPMYLNNLGGTCRHLARYEDAEAFHKRAIDCWKVARSRNREAERLNLMNLALIYGDQARYVEAEGILRPLLDQSTEHTPDHIPAMVLQVILAEYYSLQGRYVEAEPLLQASRAAAEKHSDQEPLIRGAVLCDVAECYVLQRRADEALPLAGQSLAIREKRAGPVHCETTSSHYTLAGIYWLQQRYEEAESSVRQALATWERVHGPNHPSVARALYRLAAILVGQGKYTEAEPLSWRSLRMREDILGRDHRETKQSHEAYADIVCHCR
jgi:tetratricopeptide (TPR) repeat protein